VIISKGKREFPWSRLWPLEGPFSIFTAFAFETLEWAFVPFEEQWLQSKHLFPLHYLIRPVKSVCFYIVFSQKHFPLLQTLSYDITLAISSKRRVALRLSRLRVGPPMITCQLSYRDITLRSSNIKNIVQFCPSPGQFVLCCFFPRTFFRRVCAWSPKNI